MCGSCKSSCCGRGSRSRFIPSSSTRPSYPGRNPRALNPTDRYGRGFFRSTYWNNTIFVDDEN